MSYIDRRIHSPAAWTGVNLSDTTDIVLADPTARYTGDDNYNTDESDDQTPRLLHANATGIVYIRTPGDNIARPFYLLRGTTYENHCVRIMLTGASGIGDGQLLVGR